jgi:membrane associated rhomboid family serine protease/Zn-finger nucleic acid-binding protein
MRCIVLPVKGTGIGLDVCSRCEIIWIDPSEFEQLPEKEPYRNPDDDLPPEAKEALAMRMIELQEERVNKSIGGSGATAEAPDEFWKIIPAFLGMPVEKDVAPVKNIPFITWGITLFCIVVYIFTFRNINQVADNWGFIPAEWLRHGGLTMITSAFLHGGFWHLLGNMYFLMIFGDNVEDEIGPFKYIGLILASIACSLFLHALLGGSDNIPMIGASGFISGVIAAYAFCFPKAKLSFVWRLHYWWALPAWFAFVVWLIIQFLFSYLSSNSIGGGVAYFAHIGGAAAGIVFAAFHKLLFKHEYNKWEDAISRDEPLTHSAISKRPKSFTKDYGSDDYYKMD